MTKERVHIAQDAVSRGKRAKCAEEHHVCFRGSGTFLFPSKNVKGSDATELLVIGANVWRFVLLEGDFRSMRYTMSTSCFT